MITEYGTLKRALLPLSTSLPFESDLYKDPLFLYHFPCFCWFTKGPGLSPSSPYAPLYAPFTLYSKHRDVSQYLPAYMVIQTAEDNDLLILYITSDTQLLLASSVTRYCNSSTYGMSSWFK